MRSSTFTVFSPRIPSGRPVGVRVDEREHLADRKLTSPRDARRLELRRSRPRCRGRGPTPTRSRVDRDGCRRPASPLSVAVRGARRFATLLMQRPSTTGRRSIRHSPSRRSPCRPPTAGAGSSAGRAAPFFSSEALPDQRRADDLAVLLHERAVRLVLHEHLRDAGHRERVGEPDEHDHRDRHHQAGHELATQSVHPQRGEDRGR